MTNKEAFIKIVQNEIFERPDIYVENYPDIFEQAYEYFKNLENSKSAEKTELTENGTKILSYMQNNYEKYNNVFKAKEIGEGLFVSSRSVSGSMKKLITEGFVEKIGSDPVAYSITDKGKEKDLSNI